MDFQIFPDDGKDDLQTFVCGFTKCFAFNDENIYLYSLTHRAIAIVIKSTSTNITIAIKIYNMNM